MNANRITLKSNINLAVDGGSANACFQPQPIRVSKRGDPIQHPSRYEIPALIVLSSDSKIAQGRQFREKEVVYVSTFIDILT